MFNYFNDTYSHLTLRATFFIPISFLAIIETITPIVRPITLIALTRELVAKAIPGPVSILAHEFAILLFVH